MPFMHPKKSLIYWWYIRVQVRLFQNANIQFSGKWFLLQSYFQNYYKLRHLVKESTRHRWVDLSNDVLQTDLFISIFHEKTTTGLFSRSAYIQVMWVKSIKEIYKIHAFLLGPISIWTVQMIWQLWNNSWNRVIFKVRIFDEGFFNPTDTKAWSPFPQNIFFCLFIYLCIIVY